MYKMIIRNITEMYNEECAHVINCNPYLDEHAMCSLIQLQNPGDQENYTKAFKMTIYITLHCQI